MQSKRKLLLLSFIITLIIIFLYIPIRTGMFERKYLESLIYSSKKIRISLEHFEKGKNIKNKNLSKFFKVIKEEYPHIALAVITDKKNRILMTGKNEKFIETNKTFDSIMDSFTNGEFEKQKNIDFNIRYYNQMRFYVFVKDIGDGKILMVFPYYLKKNLIIGLILEIMLIIVISLLSTSLLYIYLKKRGIIYEVAPYKVRNILQKGKSIPEYREKIIQRVSNIAFDTLNDYVYELFNNISLEYNPEIITLYIVDKNTTAFHEIYKLKGKAFIKIDEKNFNPIDISSQIKEELQGSSILILEKGKKITLPIIYRNSLLGIINIIRDRVFVGPEINEIKVQLTKLAQPLSEYLLLNDMVIDNETGLYSKTYFKLKYDEQKKLFQNKKNSFAILCISISREELKLEVTKKNMLIKTISSRIFGFLKDDDIICLFNGYIAILIPNTDLPKAEKIGHKILESFLDNRIKIGKKEMINIQLYIGLASTDTSDGDEDILETAFQNLRYAQTLNESNLQSRKINNIRL